MSERMLRWKRWPTQLVRRTTQHGLHPPGQAAMNAESTERAGLETQSSVDRTTANRRLYSCRIHVRGSVKANGQHWGGPTSLSDARGRSLRLSGQTG